MTRIAGVEKGKESWLLRIANRMTRKQRGVEFESVAIMGHNSWVLGAVGAFETAMGRAKSVPESLKTLVDIKTAMQIGCTF